MPLLPHIFDCSIAVKSGGRRASLVVSSRILQSVFRIPIIYRVLVPIINLLLQRHHPGFLRAQPGISLIAIATTGPSTYTKLHVPSLTAVQQRAVPGFPPPLQHPPVIPRAQTNSAQATDDIGNDVVWIERAVIRQCTLQDLRTDAEAEGANQKRQV